MDTPDTAPAAPSDPVCGDCRHIVTARNYTKSCAVRHALNSEGEVPRRYDDWRKDDGTALWWYVGTTGGNIIGSPNYMGSPLRHDWPYSPDDGPSLLWVPLPTLARGRP